MKLVACPFCLETDFDLVGLKTHLIHDCEKYRETDSAKRPFLGVTETKGSIDAKFIESVEKYHFRTNEDTGANLNALLIWNLVREHVGLKWLDKEDLRAYCPTCDEYHHKGECLTSNERKEKNK